MNEINKTLYIPLYGKAKVSKMGIILNDKTAETIWDENAVSLGRKSKSKWLAYFMAMRARVFDDWVRHMLSENSDAIVIHIGCGLDSRVSRIGPVNTMWYDMDFPEVIAERKKFYAETAHYHMLSGNAADPMWLTQIPAGEAAVIVMEGVGMYLAPKELAGLFERLEDRFSSLCLLMDVYTRLGANLTRFKNPIHEVGVTKTYGIDDPAVPLGTSGIRYVREHSMTPSELVAELKGFEGFFFKTLFSGKFAKKLYRMYEYQCGY